MLAGCGGGGSDGPATAPGESSAPARAYSATSIKTFTEYTGSTPGRADQGNPIRIGFVNTDEGPAAAPENTTATKEAVRFVNEQLGGVKGRPIELVECHPVEAQQAKQCADTFVADPAIVAVIQGYVDPDVTGFHATLAPKLPIIGALPLVAADAAAPNSYYLSSGHFGGLGVVTYALQYAQAKSVSMLVPGDSVASEAAIGALRTILEASKITVSVTPFPFGTTDLNPYIASSKAKSSDLFIPAVTQQQQCVALSRALQQNAVTTPVVAFTGCLGAEVRKTLGDYPLWSFIGFSVSADAPASDDLTAWRVRAFNEWFAPLETRAVTRNSGVNMLQTVLTMVKMLNEAPEATPAAIGAQLKRFQGPVYLGVPRLTFGQIPGLPAIGSLSSRVYTYLGNDQWRDTTNGNWLEPPNLTRR